MTYSWTTVRQCLTKVSSITNTTVNSQRDSQEISTPIITTDKNTTTIPTNNRTQSQETTTTNKTTNKNNHTHKI
jgi:hypothetical protein